MTDPAAPLDRYRPRSDVSTVPPQGDDVAKRCPLRVQFDVHPPFDTTRAEPSSVDRLRIDDSVTFGDRIFAELLAAHPGAVRVPPDGTAAEREAATAAALAQGAPLVLGGRLPVDEVGRRRGGPDVLVRAERRPDGRWAYHPLAVRHRLVLDAGQPPTPDAAAVVAPLASPAHADARTDPEHLPRLARAHLLLLAHHHRLLEAAGHDAATPVGAVVGKEEVAVWARLDVPSIRQRWDKRRAADETALQRYDFEFSFRLDVLAAAAEGTPLVEPVWIGECTTCPWVAHCRPQLEAADSVSLLPGLGYEQWRALRRAGVATRADLARLDLRSAELRDAYARLGDLAELADRAAALPADTPVAELLAPPAATAGPTEVAGPADGAAHGAADVGDSGTEVAVEVDPEVVERRAAAARARVDQQAATLAGAGVLRTGDLGSLDPVALALVGQPIRSLADAVQGARAVGLGGGPLLRHGLRALEVPSADVEIDIDMENGIDGTAYLWGAWVDGRYHAAASWDPPGPAVQAAVFVEFWTWLEAQRTAAAAAGRSLVTYCWYRGAESRALKEGAAAAAAELGLVDAPAAVDDFLASPQFVDLWEVFTTQLVTGGSHGLKVVAGLAGFSWRDADPDGALSMVWHAEATTDPDPAVRAAAQQRLLAYNEDDVRATAAVRTWMRTLPHLR
ncbi:ribonuclease H-like domain-containing protein [Aquihabitans sp. G128]|uniref:ribonuclease H-like domain-containing protein n=1 Tax=Aquihabitans sp. G128 TaxID=2849779 RepID=UPI001C21C4ED|nr:ribonuclease H-like domain-containing protein [Aquihabitans sp. G128]QXC61108.1 ribonuclease H-like domain-containing protein [Aquihabitans sp. G128]